MAYVVLARRRAAAGRRGPRAGGGGGGGRGGASGGWGRSRARRTLRRSRRVAARATAPSSPPSAAPEGRPAAKALLRSAPRVHAPVKWSSAALLVLLVALLAPGSASARVMQTGIADDAVLLGGGREADDAVDDWRAMGVDVARIQVSWGRIAPSPTATKPPPGFQAANPDDPGYNWGVIDAAMGRLARVGIKPMLMIDGPPPLWASGNPARRIPRYRPSAPAFANFASAVARRYGASGGDYSLGNEPNLPLWIRPQADCGKHRCTPVASNVYRAMVNAAYPAIHAVDGDARVLIGALAPAGGGLTSAHAHTRRRRPREGERKPAPGGVRGRPGLRRRGPQAGPHGRLPRLQARARGRD